MKSSTRPTVSVSCWKAWLVFLWPNSMHGNLKSLNGVMTVLGMLSWCLDLVVATYKVNFREYLVTFQVKSWI